VRAKSRNLGILLGLVGGVLIIGGTLASWGQSQGISVGDVVIASGVVGWQTSLGLLATAAGVGVLILAVIALLTTRRTNRVLGICVILAAMITGAAVILCAIDLNQTYIDFALERASEAGLSMVNVERSIRQFLDSGTLTVDPGLGLWLSGAGAVLALVGGLLLVTRSGKPRKPNSEMGFGDAS
jgi:hypothetical protein